jgi:asparagine synthase (glutamine-hydrolysing)
MSGILGLFNQDGAPVVDRDLVQMACMLERRGPEGTACWRSGSIGLGHTRLATTPEAVFERLPLAHADTGCVITADVRLDNRAELIAALRIPQGARPTGDAEILLSAYVAWGESCVERLLGDFAFGIWDPRRRALYCARDHFGMRPFYYHNTASRFFAFASEPRAILVLSQTPYRINEGRIADYLVSQLEGIDKTSTFFEEVFRLPPAHALTVTPEGVRLRRYWTLEPGPELQLPSNQAYAEAFLDVFSEAVRCRLRSAGPVGSMLSGGMDSGSVVAVARGLLAKEGRGPLPTFSATAPDPNACIETRTIQAALTMDDLDPCTIHYGQLDELMPELEDLTWSLDEPFDGHMALIRVIYLAARRRGIKVLLDGVAGDTMLSEGSHLVRLMRAGRWVTAYREAVGQNRFWGGNHYPPLREWVRSGLSAFAPDSVRQLRRRLLGPWRARRALERNIRESIIDPAFARRVNLMERLRILAAHRSGGFLPDLPKEHAQTIDHPYLTIGRERYGRVASAVAVEPRDPFADRRVAAFCVRLPGEQKLDGGWPKAVLRRAMDGRLPDAVRWRRGKESLGWSFNLALMKMENGRVRVDAEIDESILAPYVNLSDRLACRSTVDPGDPEQVEKESQAAHLAAWLHRHAKRPRTDAWI